MLMLANRSPSSTDDEKKDGEGVGHIDTENKAVANFHHALAAVKRAMNQLAKDNDKR